MEKLEYLEGLDILDGGRRKRGGGDWRIAWGKKGIDGGRGGG